VSDEAHRSESVTREPNRYLSGAIARLIYQFRVDQLPAAVITIARQHLLDTVVAASRQRISTPLPRLAPGLYPRAVPNRQLRSVSTVGCRRRRPRL